jgi:hypothetical protein
LADPPIGRISTTCIYGASRSADAVYYHNLMQHHYDFIVQGNISAINKQFKPQFGLHSTFTKGCRSFLPYTCIQFDELRDPSN